MMDLDIVRDIPGYQFILKTVLRSQILTLVEQLSQYTGEESFIMTTCVSDGTFSHLGSNDVKDFLEGRDDVKAQFMKHCIKKSITKSKQDPNSSTTTSAMSPDASFGTMPQPRIENPSTIPTQSEIHETDMSRYDQPTPVQLLRNTANTSTIEITPSTSFSGTMGKRVPKMPTRFTIDLKKNLSEKNSPGLKRSKTGQVQQTITSSFGIRDARAASTQNPCVSSAEKRVFTEIQDQGHNEQSAKKLKISHENFGLSSTVENVHSSVVGSESRLEDLSLISMKQELDDTDEAAYITSGDGDKTSTGNLSMTVFVEDMPSGSKKDTKTVPQVTSPILTGLRKKRKTSKFLQLDAIDCASEQELNAAIGEDDDGDQTKEAEVNECLKKEPVSDDLQLLDDDLLSLTRKKGSRNYQTIALKMEVLQEYRKGQKTLSEIARVFGLPRSTIYAWITKAEKIAEDHYKSGRSLTCKAFKARKWECVESQLLDWYHLVRQSGRHLTGPMLIRKARIIAKELNATDFVGSNGWLHKFQQRYGITFGSKTYRKKSVFNKKIIESENDGINCKNGFTLSTGLFGLDIRVDNKIENIKNERSINITDFAASSLALIGTEPSVGAVGETVVEKHGDRCAKTDCSLIADASVNAAKEGDNGGIHVNNGFGSVELGDAVTDTISKQTDNGQGQRKDFDTDECCVKLVSIKQEPIDVYKC